MKKVDDLRKVLNVSLVGTLQSFVQAISMLLAVIGILGSLCFGIVFFLNPKLSWIKPLFFLSLFFVAWVFIYAFAIGNYMKNRIIKIGQELGEKWTLPMVLGLPSTKVIVFDDTSNQLFIVNIFKKIYTVRPLSFIKSMRAESEVTHIQHGMQSRRKSQSYLLLNTTDPENPVLKMRSTERENAIWLARFDQIYNS